MGANKAEICISGSVCCLVDDDHTSLFPRQSHQAEASVLEVMLWCGLCPMGIGGVLVTHHMF